MRTYYDVSFDGQEALFRRQDGKLFAEHILSQAADGFLTVAPSDVPGVAGNAEWSYRLASPRTMQASSSATGKVLTYRRCDAGAGASAAPPSRSGLSDRRLGADAGSPRADAAPPAAATVAGGKAASAGEMYRQPVLDPLTLAFLYKKATSVVPDFRAYAEHTKVYEAASAFDKQNVLANEMQRLETIFDGLDLNRLYTMQISGNLRQYDAGRAGFLLDFPDNFYVPIEDPAENIRYSLRFSNVADFTLIPMAGAESARDFSMRFKLDSRGDFASSVVFSVVFRLGSPPPPFGDDTPVIADLVAARLVLRDGRVLADLGPRAPAGDSGAEAERATPAATTPPSIPDLQGIRIGMPFQDAVEIGSKGWTTARPQRNEAAYFNNYENKNKWSQCGEVRYSTSVSDNMAMTSMSLLDQRFTDCISFRSDDSGVRYVYAEQHLSGVSAPDLRKKLTQKYGIPSKVSSSSNEIAIHDDYTWTSASAVPGEFVKIDATIENDAPGSRSPDIKLTITLSAYLDPKAKAPESRMSGGPRL